LICSLFNVYTHGTRPWKASVSLLPYTILVAASTLWLYHCNEIFVDGDYLGFYLGFGFTFASLVARIIVAHVTHLPFPGPVPAYFLSLPYVVVVSTVACFSDMILEHSAGYLSVAQLDVSRGSVIWFWAVLACSEYVWYAYRVCTEVCGYLDIWCLVIKHPKVDNRGKEISKKAKKH
jgi:hypothetical protein